MKRFREFLIESPWMYHGAASQLDGPLRAGKVDGPLDRAIGAHFASDVLISDKFSSGLYGKEGLGHLYRAKAPPRSKLFVVNQSGKRTDGSKYTKFDQTVIGSFIAGTVFAQSKDMFRQWWMKRMNAPYQSYNEKMADEIYDLLVSGKSPYHEKFGVASSRDQSIRSYVANMDSNLIGSGDEFKKVVVDKFVSIMKARGYEGLIYKNTSPNETENIRSPKSYVIFEPEKLELKKINRGNVHVRAHTRDGHKVHEYDRHAPSKE